MEPNYPDRAQRRGVSGHVVVAFTINADGSVSGASVASSDPPGEFDSAALKAVGKWRYTAPGQPVSKHVKITFKLPED